jgi:hypothetical protein
MTLDVTSDFAVFDGVQTLILSSGNSTGTINGCSSSPLSRSQVEMLGGSLGLESQYRNFSLPVANCSGLTPHDGDTLTDENEVVWRVLKAELRTLGSRWLCMCIRNQ